MPLAQSRDRGAAAVEFAIVVPLLLALLLGIAAFGHAYHVQSVLSNAARDAVREVALQGENWPDRARNAAISSAKPSADLTKPGTQIDIPTSACAAGSNVTVTITYPMELLLFGDVGGPITLTGKGTMRCNG